MRHDGCMITLDALRRHAVARTLFAPTTLKLHKRAAWISLSPVVLAAITGIVMVSLAQPVLVLAGLEFPAGVDE